MIFWANDSRDFLSWQIVWQHTLPRQISIWFCKLCCRCRRQSCSKSNISGQNWSGRNFSPAHTSTPPKSDSNQCKMFRGINIFWILFYIPTRNFRGGKSSDCAFLTAHMPSANSDHHPTHIWIYSNGLRSALIYIWSIYCIGVNCWE